LKLLSPAPRLTGLTIMAVAAVLVVGCTGGTRPQRGSETLPAAGATRPAGAHSVDSINNNLPADFEVQAYRRADALGGERVRLSEVLAQGKPVALNFFAGLCPPCRAEMPDLQKVHDQLGDRFILLGVDVGPYTGLGTNDDGLQLVEDLNITFPTASTRDSQVVNRYRILGMPSTVFVTPDGKVLRKWDGALTQAKMQELVEELIRASGT
jgi:thiol-disulfide isomerase/thioredoxin